MGTGAGVCAGGFVVGVVVELVAAGEDSLTSSADVARSSVSLATKNEFKFEAGYSQASDHLPHHAVCQPMCQL